MLEMARANPELLELESIMTSLSCACKTISHLVRRADLDQLTGLAGNVNVQGEDQKKLDVMTNDVLKKALQWSGKLASLASEEEDLPVLLVEEAGEYVAVFDPLDGSSNVDANIPTGTIFGIFKRPEECELDFDGDDEFDWEQQCIKDSLQPGENLIAAGYCLYSAATTFVLTIGNGVTIFTLDASIGEFRLTHSNVVIPRRGSVYSMNESNRHGWDEPFLNYIDDIQQGKGQSRKKYTSRYIGSMVADVHRTILYGGIFGYPADQNNPDGKLRLLYEAAPMSYIVEQAGGLALTGKNRIMELGTFVFAVSFSPSNKSIMQFLGIFTSEFLVFWVAATMFWNSGRTTKRAMTQVSLRGATPDCSVKLKELLIPRTRFPFTAWKSILKNTTRNASQQYYSANSRVDNYVFGKIYRIWVFLAVDEGRLSIIKYQAVSVRS